LETYSTKQIAIFNATLQLVEERGFHGTPMSAVAEKAKVATGTIYHYFKGKDQLLKELYAFCRHQLVEVTIEAAKEKNEYKEKFKSIWIALYNFYINNSQILIFFELYINSPFSKNKQNYKTEEDTTESSPLYNFINIGKDNGQLKNITTDILLIQILSNCVAYAKLHLFTQHNLNVEDIDIIVEMTWDAISQSNKVENQ